MQKKYQHIAANISSSLISVLKPYCLTNLSAVVGERSTSRKKDLIKKSAEIDLLKQINDN